MMCRECTFEQGRPAAGHPSLLSYSAVGWDLPKVISFQLFLEEKKFRSSHSRFAFHIVLSTDLTTFLWHKLLKLTYSKEARPKEDELQH